MKRRLPLSRLVRLGGVAVEAALDLPAQEEHQAGGAVVRALLGVLLDAPAELGPGHDQHVVGVAVAVMSAQKALKAVAELGQQRFEALRLLVWVSKPPSVTWPTRRRVAGSPLSINSARMRKPEASGVCGYCTAGL